MDPERRYGSGPEQREPDVPEVPADEAGRTAEAPPLDEDAAPRSEPLPQRAGPRAEPRGEVLGAPEDVPPEDVPPEVPSTGASGIVPEDFDPTLAVLQRGVREAAMGRAIAEVEAWEQRLDAAGAAGDEFEPIKDNLAALRAALSGGEPDVSAVSLLRVALSEQVKQIAGSDFAFPVADKLDQLGRLLDSEGRALTG